MRRAVGPRLNPSMSTPPGGHMQPQLRWWTRIDDVPGEWSGGQNGPRRKRLPAHSGPRLGRARRCSRRALLAPVRLRGASAVQKLHAVLELVLEGALEARLEEAQHRGLLGLEARQLVAQLLLDLLLDLEEQLALHIGGQHLGGDVAFAADCRR